MALKQTPEGGDTEVHTVDDTTEQLPSEVPPDTPVDDQTATCIPVAEDAILEPTPVDIIEITPEEITTVEVPEVPEVPEIPEIPETDKPETETVQMDVEESDILPEPEDKANEKSQQREGMDPSS